MRAVVVDTSGKYAVVLNKKGEFIKIRNKDSLQVGYEIEVPSIINFTSTMKLTKVASIAAIFLFVAFIGLGAYGYTVPYSYIDIDINPSVEITTNIYDRVIDVVSLNEDGRELLTKLDSIKNKGIEDGIDSILDKAEEKGYFKDETRNAVMLTVSSKNETKAAKIKEEVQQVAAKKVQINNANAEVVVEKVNLERHDDAKKIGISPGKLMLIEKAIESNPGQKVEDLKDKPVKEILKSIKAGKKADKEDSDEKKPDKEKTVEQKSEGKSDLAKGKSEDKQDSKNEDSGSSKKGNDKGNDKVKEKYESKIENKDKENNGKKNKDKNVEEKNGKDRNKVEDKSDKTDKKEKVNERVKDKMREKDDERSGSNAHDGNNNENRNKD